MSFYDKLLIKTWMLRRFVFNQPYIVTSIKSPVITLDLEEPCHYAGRKETSKYKNRDYLTFTMSDDQQKTLKHKLNKLKLELVQYLTKNKTVSDEGKKLYHEILVILYDWLNMFDQNIP